MTAPWVIKVGSALITANTAALQYAWLARVAVQFAALRSRGQPIVLVSSGAVAAGMTRLRLAERPADLARLQAIAAVGQPDVVQAWSAALAPHHMTCAQLLLSHEDARDRERYLNARATLRALLELGVLPIINENDSVATEEIRFGDNDRLAAMVADLVGADRLLLLTDQEGLYTANPRLDRRARRISHARANDRALDAMAGEGGALGRGGMVTKLSAARRAARSGIETWILNGARPELMAKVGVEGGFGTRLCPAANAKRWSARKRWLGAAPNIVGAYRLDDGAVKALRSGAVSLLPVGVVGVVGEFARGEIVACHDASGRVVAQGLSNYSAADSRRLLGARGEDVAERLGRPGESELIHRDNLVVVDDV